MLGSLKWLRLLDLRKEFEHVFSIDLRSLAITRILTGLIIAADLAIRLPYIEMFYGDGGVLPHAAQQTFWMGEWAWSLHLLFGGPTGYVALLFFVQGLFACALMAGYQTRIASVVSWILLVSLQNANPFVLLGGDFLLRGIVFVGMFLPWGEFISLDRYLSRTPASRVQVLSPWSAAFLIQLAFMYYFASLFKNSIEWTASGNALYYIASIDQYATPLSTFMLQFPAILKLVTFGVVHFQHLAIYLLFFPFWNKYVRSATAFVLIMMHLTFALASHLGIFSWIAIAGLISFMPGIVWDKVLLVTAKMRGYWINEFRRQVVNYRTIGNNLTESRSQRVGTTILMCAGVAFIAYSFLWQAYDFSAIGRHLRSYDLWTLPAKTLRIDQRWNLFAPRPYVNDGWDIVEGTLVDGRVVDLFRDGAPVNYDKPADVYALYHGSHRREFTLEMRRPANERFRPYYAEYLCRSWNSTHEGDERLVSLELVFMLEETAPPGYAQAPVERQSLLSFTCI